MIGVGSDATNTDIDSSFMALSSEIIIKKTRTDCNCFAVRKNYYYIYMLEVVTYYYSTSFDVNFMEIKFKKYGK